MRILAGCVLLIALVGQARGEDHRQLDVNIFGLSHHQGGNNGGKLNEENLGVGFRYNLSSRTWNGFLGLKPFIEADLIKNSQRGWTTVVGGGLKNDAIFRLGQFSFGGGGAVVNIGYENPRIGKTIYRWAPVVFLSMTYNDRVSLNVIPVPKDHKNALLFSLTFKHVW